MAVFLDPHHLMSLVILITLEITLAADNIIFLVTACSRLPQAQQKSAMKIGLVLAAITRLAFLALMLSATMLTDTLFSIGCFDVSVRDLVLIIGGLFLMIKPVVDIHETRHEAAIAKTQKARYSAYWLVMLQIMFVDLIFSVDSVITAIGVSHNYTVMAIAIIISVLFMMMCSGFLQQMIQRYPVFKIFALSFLSLIGVVLVLRGLHFDVSSSHIYVPFVFAIFTQMMLAYARVK